MKQPSLNNIMILHVHKEETDNFIWSKLQMILSGIQKHGSEILELFRKRIASNK